MPKIGRTLRIGTSAGVPALRLRRPDQAGPGLGRQTLSSFAHDLSGPPEPLPPGSSWGRLSAIVPWRCSRAARAIRQQHGDVHQSHPGGPADVAALRGASHCPRAGVAGQTGAHDRAVRGRRLDRRGGAPRRRISLARLRPAGLCREPHRRERRDRHRGRRQERAGRLHHPGRAGRDRQQPACLQG